MFKKIVRRDGSSVILAPKQDTQAATVQVMYKIGSRQESSANNGASHFVEHLMFKGTKKRPTTLDISKTLDAVGAEYNAFTSKDRTAYYVRADSTHLPLAFDILSDMLRHSIFDPKEVDKERGVIIEEINMYEDNPVMYLDDIFESLVYKGSSLARLIIGPRANIAKNISRETLYQHKKRWYYPGNMSIGVAGKFDEATILKLIDRYFPVEKSKKPKARVARALLKQQKPQIHIMTKETEQVQLMLGFPGLPSRHRDLPALTVLSNILGGTMSSRLFINLREKRGLCYSIRAGSDSHEDVGSFAVRAGLDKSRVVPALKLITEELRRDLIKQNIEEAENLKKEFQRELKEQEVENKKIIDQMQKEVAQAKKEAEQKADELLIEAEEERKQIIAETKKQVQVMKEKIHDEIEHEIIARMEQTILEVIQNKVPKDIIKQSVKETWKQLS
jgi:predicted Zn-dependent peptidase